MKNSLTEDDYKFLLNFVDVDISIQSKSEYL